MYFEDLTKYCFYLKKPVETVKNVGWLDAKKSFNRGEVDLYFLEKLSAIILGSENIDVHVNRVRSADSCALFDCDVKEIKKGSRSEYLGTSEIWFPSVVEGEFFAAPSLVYHYVAEHNYLPPKEFIISVMNFNLDKSFNAQALYLSVIKGHF
jgi:hypothetical protein